MVGSNCVGPLKTSYFSINLQSALCVPSFHSYGFNQPQIETVFLILSWESVDAEG